MNKLVLIIQIKAKTKTPSTSNDVKNQEPSEIYAFNGRLLKIQYKLIRCSDWAKK